jgi:hypothetical protein
MSYELRIRENYQSVQERIAAAAKRVGRDPKSIHLVAVTKGQPVEAIETLYSLGQRPFGENRIQEGQTKASQLKTFTDIHWHMIGQLTNRDTVGLVKSFHFLHALTSEKIAAQINEFSRYRGVPFPVLLEFNVSGETQKGGWLADDESRWTSLLPVVERIAAMPFLDVQGLMAMAPFNDDPEAARPYFARLRLLRDWLSERLVEINLPQLSMGMSQDFETAVEEGSTLLRIGSAIFTQ